MPVDTIPFEPRQFDLLTLRDAITRSAEASQVLSGDAGSTDPATAFTDALAQGATQRLIEGAHLSSDPAAAEVARRWEELGADVAPQDPGPIVNGHGPDEVPST